MLMSKHPVMSKREEIQNEALTAAVHYNRCGLAVSMGVGKTLIGLRYIDYYQNRNMHKLNVLVVAPKLTIFDTWRSEAEKFNIDIQGVTFTTYLSLNKLSPFNYDLVVLDECHNLLHSHAAFLEQYRGRILGLTGTPPRYSNSEKGFMVNKYCPIIYKYITDDAVEDKILNDYRIYVHNIPLSDEMNLQVTTRTSRFTTSERKNYEYWTKRILSADTKKEEQIASVMRMRAMMDFSSKEQYAKNLMKIIEDKCIIFCNTQEQADRLCSRSYHANNPAAEDNLQDFKNDRIMQLSCVLQLNEGVNIPNLKSGIILHSYGNERKSSQRIGRLLRLNPTETAVIHILCYTNTVDEKWVREALKDLDPEKIKHFSFTTHDKSSTL